MNAETDQAAEAGDVLYGRYEWIQFDRAASFLDAHPPLVPLLEDLHSRLSTAFPRARFVARRLNSPQVPSPAGDGHLLIVVVPAEPTGGSSERLSELLREWAPRQAAARSFLLVDAASAMLDPFASEADATALYVRRRSDDYKHFLHAARRFVAAPANSRERFHAAATLSAVRHSHQTAAQRCQPDEAAQDDEQAPAPR